MTELHHSIPEVVSKHQAKLNRQAAKDAGAKTYIGFACKHHPNQPFCVRYVSTNPCVSGNNERQKQNGWVSQKAYGKRKRKKSETPYILYWFRFKTGEGLIKQGYTNNFRQLYDQLIRWDLLELLAYVEVPGNTKELAKEVEDRAKQVFAEYRIGKTERFTPGPKLMRWIEAIKHFKPGFEIA